MRTEDVIRVARAPRRLAGEPRLRHGLERWLADCDPTRHGLPGEAIVLVRRLSARWGVVLDPDPARRYAPLAAMLTGAQRAATADADADVVWFADEAELLACIARDALSGALGDRWWWRVLRPGRLEPGSSIAPAWGRWLESPRQIPRAVLRLGEARALAWLASPAEAIQARMLEALAQAYPLAPQLRDWVLEGHLPTPVADPASEPTALPPPSHRAGPAARAPASRAARLHRLSLALVRDAGAAASLQALRMLAASETPPAPIARSSPATHLLPEREAGHVMAIRLHAPERGRREAGAEPIVPVPVARLAGHAEPPHHVAASHGKAASAPEQPPACLPLRAAPAARASASSAASRDAVEALLEAPPQRRLHTRYGGVLFLLNAALQLSLYGDFTKPRHRGLDCSPWRFLMLAGRAWCGPGLQRDPLWAWLRHRASGSRQAVPLHVWPELHARLARALDDGEPGITLRRRICAMLDLPARLQDAGERLDLHFALAELPLAVRLSGLDRDPGWIPAAGCDIRFHFD